MSSFTNLQIKEEQQGFNQTPCTIQPTPMNYTQQLSLKQQFLSRPILKSWFRNLGSVSVLVLKELPTDFLFKHIYYILHIKQKVLNTFRKRVPSIFYSKFRNNFPKIEKGSLSVCVLDAPDVKLHGFRLRVHGWVVGWTNFIGSIRKP